MEKVKNKKFSITLLLLLICFVIGSILLIVANKQFTSGLEDIGGEIPQKIKATQESYLRKNEALLRSLAFNLQEVHGDEETINVEHVKKFINNYAEILKIDNAEMYAVINNKFYSFSNKEYNKTYTETEWYQKAIVAEENQIVYSNATYDSVTNEPVITASMKMKGTQDVIAINIFPERITTWSDIGNFPIGACYYIIDSSGTIIHQDNSQPDANQDEVKKNIDEIYLELGIEEEDIANTSYVEDTINKNAGLFTIETYNGWKIIVRIPYADMLDSTRTILIAYYTTTILFSMLILYLAYSGKNSEKGKALYTKISNVLSDSYYALYLVDYEKE